jgi:hypothetical protein
MGDRGCRRLMGRGGAPCGGIVTPPTADDRSEGWHGASMTRADLHRLVDELSEEAVARLHRGNAITLAVVRDEGHLIMHEIDPE